MFKFELLVVASVLALVFVQAEAQVSVESGAQPVESQVSQGTQEEIINKVYEKLKADKKGESSALQFSGDFRFRHQSETKATSEERRIQRLQVKLAAAAEIHENLKFNLRFMTGKDAVSGNQTLGDPKSPPMARRDFGLDQAFFEYQAFPI